MADKLDAALDCICAASDDLTSGFLDGSVSKDDFRDRHHAMIKQLADIIRGQRADKDALVEEALADRFHMERKMDALAKLARESLERDCQGHRC